MRCPYCLQPVKVFAINTTNGAYQCPVCKTVIPRGYVDDRHIPRSTVGMVGFSGHGKTVYLTSLFYELTKFSRFWEGFYYRSLDDFTHKILYNQVPLFEKGILPESTPANFPNPALIQYNNLPVYDDAYLGFYDTAGEVFNDAMQTTRAGYFVAHSNVVLFILSLPDCGDNRLDDELSRLLDTYIRAVHDQLKIELKTRQRIIIILSKGDMYHEHLPDHLQDWLYTGNYSWYLKDMGEKLLDMTVASLKIEEWLRNDKGCYRFTNMLKEHFSEARYTIVSSTGANGATDLEPCRVLDPFFWILSFAEAQKVEEKKRSGIKGLWQKLLNRNK